MFDIGIGFSEILLLAVLVIIVVGPEELPGLLRTVGRYIGQVKRVADDFRAQVDDAIKDPMEEIQESIAGVTEDLDDDPFGEEDLIDFEEHNQKILDKEKADKADGELEKDPEYENETATQKALREGGVAGLEVPAGSHKVEPLKADETKSAQASEDLVESDELPAKISGT